MIASHALVRATPESQGISSRAIDNFVAAVDREALGLHSLMLLRHGRVVAEGWWEPYRAQTPHMLFSLSKSFTSTAVGLLVAEGRLSVDDFVLQFFADETPAQPSANLRAMRVRHLLTMTTGHDTEPEGPRHAGLPAAPEAPGTWTSRFLAHSVPHEPGTHFLYNTAATHVLSAIVQHLTGRRLLQYLQPRLFEPLGIEHPTWEIVPPGVDAGGYGLSITTEDIARFGQLYLQRGTWQGAQLVPEAWMEAATKAQVPSQHLGGSVDWIQGYGYQFWRCRHDAYRGDGAFGQYCLVMPAQDAVLAITAGTPDMQIVLDRVWRHLLPAMASGSLPEDGGTHDALVQHLADLRLPVPVGQRVSARTATVTGKMFTLPENENGLEAIGFDFAAGDAVLVVRNQAGEQRIPCGYGTWAQGTAVLLAADPMRTAASGTWTDERTFVAHVCFCETPFLLRVTCRFDGERVLLKQCWNVGFGPTSLPDLKGYSGS